MLPLRLCTILSLLVVSLPKDDLLAGDAVVQKFGDWTVTIQPGPPGSGVRDWVASPPRGEIQLVSQEQSEDGANVPAAPAAEAAADPLALVQHYSQVYDRIPFSRAEYMANPSYRHDATMEFLFGKMRSTVINRGGGSRSNAPAMRPAYYPQMSGYYWFNSPYYGYYSSYPYWGWLQPASLW